MARFFAQLCTAIFAVALIGGLLLGNAAPLAQGDSGGNLGGITLHMTWTRDALDAVLLLVFAFVGFVADRHTGRVVMLGLGVAIFGLGALGVVVGDDAQASKAIADLNFPVVINIFDLAVGMLAVLAALGTIDEHAPDSTPRKRQIDRM